MLDSILELGKVWVYDCHPPFHPTLMFAWIRLFGDSEVAVRVPPFLFGLSSIVLAYHLAAQWWDVPTARLTAILMCFSPVHIWYSSEARQYATTVFLIVAWAFIFERIAVEGLSRRMKLLYASVAVAAVFTHFFNAYFLFVFAIIAWRYHPRIRQFVVWTHSFCAMLLAALFAVKFVVGSLQGEADHLRHFNFHEAYTLFASWFVTGNVFDAWAADRNSGAGVHILIGTITLSVFALALAGMRDAAIKTTPRLSQLFLMLVLGLPCALLVLSLMLSGKIYVERSLLAVLPFHCMAIARGVMNCTSSRSFAATTGLTAFMCITFLVFMKMDHKWTVYKQKAEWREASDYLAERGIDGERMHVFVARPARELTYYLPFAAEVRNLGALVHARNGRFEKAGGRIPLLGRFYHKAAEGVLKKMENRIANASLHIRTVGVDALTEFLNDSNNTKMTLICNEFWLGGFPELIRAVDDHEHWKAVESASFKGLRIFECTRKVVG